MKVYVVEDSPVVQERLIAILHEIPGVEIVGVADDSATALSAIPRLRPDAVVLDIRLRSGNGIDVLKGIRNRCNGMTKIVLTNYASSAIRDRCLTAGADYFLDKSTEFDQIEALLAPKQPIGASVRAQENHD